VKSGKATYSGFVRYTISNEFKDVLDYHNQIPDDKYLWEIPGGNGYWIEGYWIENFKGKL
jgi:hypothetical protein